jgi:DNA-binding beta-propeller fold protein YncE
MSLAHIQQHFIGAALRCILLWFCVSFLLLFLSTLYTLRVYAQEGPIIGVLHSGQRPEALAVDIQTHMLYIAHESPGTLVAFDPISGKVRWQAALGTTTTDVQVDSSNHHVYAAALGNGQSNLFILDGATGHIITKLPIGSGDNSIAIDDKRRRVYVVTPDTATLTTFSLNEDATLHGKALQQHIGSRPTAVGVNSRLGRLYIADSRTNTIKVSDEDSGRNLATIAVGAFPLPPLRIDETSGRLYVVCSTAQELNVIDGYSNKVIAHPLSAPYPEGVAFNTATGRIYVANEGDEEGNNTDHTIGNTVTVIDKQSFAVLGTLQVGAGPDGVEADPALHRVYVALEDSNAVVELTDSPDLSLNTDTVRQTVLAQQTLVFLRQTTYVTLALMVVTIVAATRFSLSPRWRAPETPQNRQGDE